ncbi:hypothetical protein HF638_27965 [Paenibacillus sp. SZ31]|uniref:hypothetical protein n=1 Tax=Paenibacillus sp. SZ31 TaxID=2725555 RepID=UPI00146F58A9|nr:hypothetical protein [Paenibacillus sp. SZ31]NMI07838.1 hypothetical protein [Paenibacillus sp. SZ31]
MVAYRKKSIKRITYVSLVVMAIISSCFYFFVYNSVKVISAQASYLEFENVEDLTDDADLVALVSPTQDFYDREHVVKTYSTGAIEDFFTLTNVNIKEIIKGEDSFPNSIEVVEPISLIQKIDGKYKLNIEGYTEMEVDKEYIVFLKKNYLGNYAVINMKNGVFDINEIKNDTFELQNNTLSNDREYHSNSFSSNSYDTLNTREKLALEIQQKFLLNNSFETER